jgi:hypothetical protein
MIKVKGERGTGKTLALLKISHDDGYIVVEQTAHQAEYAMDMAKYYGYDSARVTYMQAFLNSISTGTREKYLFDEIDALLSTIGVVGYSETTMPAANISGWPIHRPKREEE